jgi:hypothetical protein
MSSFWGWLRRTRLLAMIALAQRRPIEMTGDDDQ